jgi:hypothetical protein
MSTTVTAFPNTVDGSQGQASFTNDSYVKILNDTNYATVVFQIGGTEQATLYFQDLGFSIPSDAFNLNLEILVYHDGNVEPDHMITEFAGRLLLDNVAICSSVVSEIFLPEENGLDIIGSGIVDVWGNCLTPEIVNNPLFGGFVSWICYENLLLRVDAIGVRITYEGGRQYLPTGEHIRLPISQTIHAFNPDYYS